MSHSTNQLLLMQKIHSHNISPTLQHNTTRRFYDDAAVLSLLRWDMYSSSWELRPCTVEPMNSSRSLSSCSLLSGSAFIPCTSPPPCLRPPRPPRAPRPP